MTIDFHPSPQDLEDETKFSVKQYSVTLPPINKTTYQSHTELLDDLLIQRMRQDFQIVPRNRIQQSSRRDVIDNMLEATLSMGHKIQRLSYNPSTGKLTNFIFYGYTFISISNSNQVETTLPQTALMWFNTMQNLPKTKLLKPIVTCCGRHFDRWVQKRLAMDKVTSFVLIAHTTILF